MDLKRTHINELTEKDKDKTVNIQGWIDTIRAHGKMVFFDIRDVTGILQTVVFAKSKDFEKAKSLLKESCVEIIGKVGLRPKGTENDKLPTGKIEVAIDELHVLNECPPILCKYTPGGARNFLVPSRIEAGKFWALPESPQLFKQLLMVAGFEKYFQIARCLRDEDLRKDRQPEFTQLDVEMSFITQEDIFHLIEGILKKIWKDVLNVDVKTPF